MEQLEVSTANCLIRRKGGILIVTLNRPEAKNALSPSMLIGMYKAWELLKNDNALKCAVLTGEGDTFCAGMDLKALSNPDEDPEVQNLLSEIPDLHWQAMLKVKRPNKPLILAAEGFALAGGTEIALGTDLRICGNSTRFGLTETRRGLFPLGGSTVRLRRQIPYVRAAEAMILGKNISAQEALNWGIVNKVVDDGGTLNAALEIAEYIETLAPLSVEAMVKSLRENEDMEEHEALRREEEIGWQILSTQDAREGLKAFKEKREPVFIGS